MKPTNKRLYNCSSRRDGDIYAVFQDAIGKFRVGEYRKGETDPYHVFEGEFDDLLLAIAVCRMMYEAYEDGYQQGQCDCH